MDDATLNALLRRRLDALDEGAPQPRGMNPWRAEPRRPERRTPITYRDPTANTAIGNLSKEKKR